MEIPSPAKPFIKRHKTFRLVLAANTWGTGATRQYVGRNQLDASTLDRFCLATIFVTYDESLESSLVKAALAEEAAAELIDRDLIRNVALLRIRPGRVLASSPIVPPNWEPKPGMSMTAAQGIVKGLFGEPKDCSILSLSKGLSHDPAYEAITCDVDSRRGFGGGLFTKAPYRKGNLLAGVCNFSAPNEKTMLYASPRMIYPILDKNGLSSLYQEEDPNLSPAPEPDFDLQEVVEPTNGFGPIDDSPASKQPAPQGPPHEARPAGKEVSGADRLRAVEQRVDAIDGKLDEVLRLLKAK
jgi:hypothetical protein